MFIMWVIKMQHGLLKMKAYDNYQTIVSVYCFETMMTGTAQKTV